MRKAFKWHSNQVGFSSHPNLVVSGFILIFRYLGHQFLHCLCRMEWNEVGSRKPSRGVVTENSVRSENTEVPIIRETMVATTMNSLFVALFALVASSFRTRAALQAEILALRHQLAVFQKNAPRRLRLQRCDRLLWVVLYRFWSGWRRCLQMVQPDTVLRWHRGAFAWHWTRKSRRLPGRPVAENIRDLIRRSNRQHEPIQPINICEKEEMIVRNTSSIANECRDSRPLWVVILLTTLFLASNLEADQQSWLVIAVL